MINAAVCGLGRAGAELVRTIADRNDMRIKAAFCSKGSEKKGRDIGLLAHIQETGIKAQEVTDAESVLGGGRIDVVIDFSNPEASKILLAACGKYGIPIVVCTTGFSDDDLKWMKRLARDKSFGLVYAPNVTLGINVLISVLKNVAQALPFFDYRITETHHSKKTDIPSGTAKKISDVLENELQLDGENPVPINSVRAGGYVGIHEVIAVGEFERLTIAHESFSRRAFADGALQAAKFVRNKKGWFEMSDIISEHPLVKMTAPDKRIARLLPNHEHNV
jgi:4-hydroxy-tetrahydrodipicolinate reductase